MTLNGAIMQLVELSEHPMMHAIFKPAIQKVIETISELEENPELHWIPVTERLPEYGEEVLTITQDDVYEVNHVIDDVHDEWFWEDNGNVIAWMPLPEPYKGVTE